MRLAKTCPDEKLAMTDRVRRLYLVRHGASEANLARPYRLQGGGVDLPLCELGRRQAQAAAEHLRDAPIRWAFSSPLQRAWQTADIIAGPHGVDVQRVEPFRECDVGRWEGLAWEEIHQRDPEYAARFKADPGAVRYPDGESFGDVQRRVVPAVDRLLQQHLEGDVLIVWHAAVGQVFVGHLLGIPSHRAREVQLDNGGVTVARLQGAKAELETVNSTEHLRDLRS